MQYIFAWLVYYCAEGGHLIKYCNSTLGLVCAEGGDLIKYLNQALAWACLRDVLWRLIVIGLVCGVREILWRLNTYHQ
jgi:hypothetical protein